MSTTRFTEDHEWIRLNADGSATVGITDHAQEALGDVVYVEQPEVGRSFAAGDAAAVVESVKAAADVKMPVTGTVTAVNQAIVDDPALVNSDPNGAAWFFTITPANPADIDGLMDEAGYQKFLAA